MSHSLRRVKKRCVFVSQSTFVHTFDVKLGIFSADMKRFRLRVCVCECVCVYVQRESTSFSCHLLFVWRSYERSFFLYQKVTKELSVFMKRHKRTTLFWDKFWFLFEPHMDPKMVHFWSHMGSIWGPYEVHTGPYGSIWGPYGTIWGPTQIWHPFWGQNRLPKRSILGSKQSTFFQHRF